MTKSVLSILHPKKVRQGLKISTNPKIGSIADDQSQRGKVIGLASQNLSRAAKKLFD